MDINYLKSLGFTEYIMEEIPICYEIEFQVVDKAISYFKFSDDTEKITIHEAENGNIIAVISKNYLEKYVNHFKWQESEILRILNTEILNG